MCCFYSIIFAGSLLSQSFDAASVKPGPPANTGRFNMTGGPGTSDPTFIRYANVPLKRVLMAAYDMKSWQIAGPDWLNTLRFDISARIPDGATKEQAQAMMRNLLTERFQMSMRRTTKDLPIYALVIDKNGAKLKVSGDTAGDSNAIIGVQKNEGKDGFPVLAPGGQGIVVETRNGAARVSGFHSDLSKLADFLSNQLGRPVFDRTGIAGQFDFTVYYRPENAPADDTNPYPGIFDALWEQLGLKLDARTGPVEMLAIDHIERVPTGNE
jgi:uncharacterized protein (TIGR03435 family)